MASLTHNALAAMLTILVFTSSHLPSSTSAAPNKIDNAQAAVSRALSAVQGALSKFGELSKQPGHTQAEASVLKDCLENVGTAADQLKQSLGEFPALKGGASSDLHWGNIQTWVSAAETNEETCLDGANDLPVSAALKGQINGAISNVEKLTSAALAIINGAKSL